MRYKSARSERQPPITFNSHAGGAGHSATTEHGNPKCVSAPRIMPHIWAAYLVGKFWRDSTDAS